MSDSAPRPDLVNPATLAELAELMDAAELGGILRQAQDELGRALPAIQSQMSAQDWTGLQHTAHRLKGALGSLGCEALYAGLHQLELGLRASPPRHPGEQELEALVRLADATQARLQQVMPRAD